MIQLIAGGVVTLVKSWFDSKARRIEAQAKREENRALQEADYDTEAMRQSQYSWKDEFITGVWYYPLIHAWFDPEGAMEWVKFVQELPYWYQWGMFGIMAASFGLRWFFKNKLLKGTDGISKASSS